MNFANPLSTLPGLWPYFVWAAVAIVPPLIVLLYFLKLKRNPIQVPSTYLWHKSIEDLRVNSIWQRLRQNLLLFLQLLLVLLVILALLGLSWKGMESKYNRHIFVLDTSASMSTTDTAPSRLEDARQQIEARIDSMQPGDTAMLVSFSDSARVEQSFTDNRRLLKQRLRAIKPTHRTTQLDEALGVAAGLANPGQSSFDNTDVQTAEALPAALYIYSDGRFPDVKNFRFGNLTPEYFPVGAAETGNVGILAFSTQHNPEKEDELQAFSRLANYSLKEITVRVELYIDGVLADASDVELPARERLGDEKSPDEERPLGSPGEGGAAFDLGDMESGVLELRISQGDAFTLDDRAWTVVSKPRPARVLFVSPGGNEFMEIALQTEKAEQLAKVRLEGPEFLATPEFRTLATAPGFDLIIFDRCQPPQEPTALIPECNTFFIGVVPPWGEWRAGEIVNGPGIIDVERVHPLMQLLELGDVRIFSGTPITAPSGSSTLIDSAAGPLFTIGPRGRYEDAVMGFGMLATHPEHGEIVNTDWPARLSFPMFVLNTLSYLGGQKDATSAASVQPGLPWTVNQEVAAESLTVVGPGGKKSTIARDDRKRFRFTETDQLGLYEVFDGERSVERFTVNLFSPLESDIKPRELFQVGAGATVEAASNSAISKRHAWKWLLLVAVAVLIFEWYIYNRRIYL